MNTIRLPRYTTLDVEADSPFRIAQCLKTAHRITQYGIVDPRTTASRCRAYSLTPKALAYLDNHECRACGKQHATQHCPTIRAALMAEAGHDN